MERLTRILAVLFMAAIAIVYFVAAGPVQPACLPFKLITAANTNPTSIATGHRNLVSVQATANSTGAFFLKFYDLGRAPNVGTDTPVQTFLVGNTATTYQYAPQGGFPMDFLTGLAFGTSANIADSDSGNIAANAIIDVCWL